MTNETCDVVYCEGWDPESASVVRQLPEATARRRDADGAQYAVVLLVADRPIALVEVCWAEHYAAAWRFDEHGRRIAQLDLRRFDSLVLRQVKQWAYGSPQDLEFDAGAPWRASTFGADGARLNSAAGWGDRPVIEIAARSWPVPKFGDWITLARLDELLGGPVMLLTAPDPDPAEPPADVPWHPPRPAEPRQLAEIFTPGTGFLLDNGREVTVEVVASGRLTLSSGRLVAADPDANLAEVPPFLDTVAPGEYPVVQCVARFAANPDQTTLAAAKLVITDAEPVHYGPALLPGQDVRMLGDGGFFGVSTRSGRIVLADLLTNTADSVSVTVTVEPGDGAYPVWVGTAADGSVTCFVLDFLVLRYAQPLG